MKKESKNVVFEYLIIRILQGVVMNRRSLG